MQILFPNIHRRRGVTLAELIVGFAVFMLLMTLLTVALNKGRAIWNRATSSTSSQLQLRKSFVPLSKELEETEFETIRVADGPSSLVGKDGDAVWFLSAQDPVTGEFRRTDDGHPLWQRNVLFYSVVPDQHDKLIGYNCTGGQDKDGYEVRCPHKLLIKKVINYPPGSSGPIVGSPDQELLPSVKDYLTRPKGLDPNISVEKGVESTTIVARDILTFQVKLEPDSSRPGEVFLKLSSARIEEARRNVQIGNSSLDSFTETFSFSVFPPNP